MFKRNKLAVLLGAVAAAAALSAPVASSAGELSQADQFARQRHISDGYNESDWDRARSGPSAVVTPATPEQLAQLALFERQRNLSDGYQETDWDKRQSPEFQAMMAKMANNPMIEALFAYFEMQRRTSDGRG